MSDGKLIGEKEACELLNVSRTTLWRLRKEGKMRFYRLGSKLGYSADQLREFLKSCEQANTAAR
jgi:excisionase family DNA binding protein